jgi:hypothetical protein
MTKRGNKYRLTLEQIELINGEPGTHKLLQLEFMNHDELFSIIERIQKKNLFADDNQSVEFAIGLKLFSEVMLRHRKHPLFEELAPSFRTFMEKLKQA